MVEMGWITWFLHGILQSILLWAPLIEPLQEDPVPNPWFDPCEIYELWAYLLDENQRPTTEFIDLYWDCIWSKFRGGIVDQYLSAIASAIIPIWDTIGSVPDMFCSIAEWVALIWAMIGENLPEWAYDVVSGLTRLWELLPEAIRDGLQTWAEFLAQAPEAIQEWVEELVGQTIAWVVELWDWYIALAQAVTGWWEDAHATLDDFLSDVYGFTARALGDAWAFLIWFWNDPASALFVWLDPWWDPLVTFATDCLDFWYNLWGSYADDLAELLADPLGFLWDRGEIWLSDRLERP